MQKIFVIGHVGNDPKVKVFENGGKAANFSVAETEREKKLKDGRTIPARTTWFDCVAKGVTADFVEKYIKKGLLVHIEAKMQTRSYTDQSGVERRVNEFVVKEINILTPKAQRQDPAPAAEPYPGEPTDGFKAPEEELPF